LTRSKNTFSSTPNLFSFLPVEICFNVLASVFGFNLIPILTVIFLLFAILSISTISLLDSAFISKIFLSIAKPISVAVLPTPEKTIFWVLYQP